MAEGAIGATFKISRALQAACMIAIIGMTSNFVSQIVTAGASPPSALVGTLSIVCVAVLYCVITFILYIDKLLPFLATTVIDCLFLIALIVVSVVVGKPLSYLNCTAIGKVNSLTSDASSFASALSGNIADGGKIPYGSLLASASKATCLEMKTVWGLCIALCILFTLSATTAICLWKRSKSLPITTKGEA